ncbi:MAG: SPFH domain-containing protein [Clostridia bacterium]|nr:SPFH domain-containing protein [Clostridia bacterium]
MGLIKAIGGAVGGVLGDQWKEYFYCDALPNDILARKGAKRISGRSSNTSGEENIISNGSVIAVADGQCMCIVEQGKVVDICAEPGEYTYDMSTEPSIFAGNLGTSILDSFKTIGRRFTFGGDTAKDQRVYYFNTKELIGNKYGTAGSVPFRVVDERAGIDIDINIRCFGEYSYRLCDPILFYTNVCGNVEGDYTRDKIDSQLKSELLTALQPAFDELLTWLNEMGVELEGAADMNAIHWDMYGNNFHQYVSGQASSYLYSYPEHIEFLAEWTFNRWDMMLYLLGDDT